MLSELFIAYFLVVYLFYLVFQHKDDEVHLPKGPSGIPFLGNLLQIVKNPHLRLSQWASQYGPLYTLSLASKKVVVLSDVTSMKEVLSLPSATGKFQSDSMLLFSRGPHGIVGSEGSIWAEQRRFCLGALVKFGFGQHSALERQILGECQDLVTRIKRRGSDPRGLIISMYLKTAMSTTFISILTGAPVESRIRETLGQLQDKYLACAQKSVNSGSMWCSAWLKNLSPAYFGSTDLDKTSLELQNFWIELINRQKKTRVAGSPRHVIDAYLDKLEESMQQEGSSFHGEDGWLNTVASIVELYGAANETTVHSVTWLLYFMAVNPAVQEKVHKELDGILGESEPTLQDKGRLPYLEAVIAETLRMCPVTSMGIPHVFMEDTHYKDWTFPKDTVIVANIWHCHYDKKVWGDPEVFRPERFLEGDRDMKEYLASFSFGKRSCLGAPLAKDIMFLFVTRMMQEFKVDRAIDLGVDHYLEADWGVGCFPKPRRLVVESRR